MMTTLNIALPVPVGVIEFVVRFALEDCVPLLFVPTAPIALEADPMTSAKHMIPVAAAEIAALKVTVTVMVEPVEQCPGDQTST
jgi:hypothetical protein